ncbi:hypothetical protein ACOSP7_016872 [Xanthoceras sorbifolium]
MSSSGDQRHHEADTGGYPNAGNRRPHSFDEVLVEYERFTSRQRTKYQGDRAATTRRSEVKGSSTSSCREARSDQW